MHEIRVCILSTATASESKESEKNQMDNNIEGNNRIYERNKRLEEQLQRQ